MALQKLWLSPVGFSQVLGWGHPRLASESSAESTKAVTRTAARKKGGACLQGSLKTIPNNALKAA